MVKRLALLCCVLLLPTIAAASSQDDNVHHGQWWVGVQLGGVFTPNSNSFSTFTPPTVFTTTTPGNPQFQIPATTTTTVLPGQRITYNLKTDPGFSAGAIVGYNFCMPYRQEWERYFGVALDFQWNQFNHPDLGGNQFALAFLGRVQYPLWGSEKFTAGRLVPFLMAGPAIVWTNSDFSHFGGGSKTATDLGVVAEVGLEFFMWPHLSIGPSFRYRHVFGPSYSSPANVDVASQLDQFMVLGRLAYHF
jgi:opacity protein-like surface antigen